MKPTDGRPRYELHLWNRRHPGIGVWRLTRWDNISDALIFARNTDPIAEVTIRDRATPTRKVVVHLEAPA